MLKNGQVVAAAQEERFTRKKHDSSFPLNALQYCLSEADIKPNQIDSVTFYEKPLLKLERLLETYMQFAPRGFRSFKQFLPRWINTKLQTTSIIDENLNGDYKGPIYFCKHHESHASFAFFSSPYEHSAIITIDGVGEWSTTTWGVGSKSKIQLHQNIQFPHSLGLLYSAFTHYCGFKINSGEYKLMGLSSYGKPKYYQLIKDHLIKIYKDGSFTINQKYFSYCYGLSMTNKKFDHLFKGPAHPFDAPPTQKQMDLACSIQKVVEEVVLNIAKYVASKTDEKSLCLAGGVALNCVANGALQRAKIFDNIWIPPAPGDAGAAIGAALWTYHKTKKNQKKSFSGKHKLFSPYTGPKYSVGQIKSTLDSQRANYLAIKPEDLAMKVAKELSENKIVGLFHGRMEFGPRALGNRSILANPQSRHMQKHLNMNIKFRESFRPFAPSCLEQDVQKHYLFDRQSPYMQFVCPAKNKTALPATTHVDGTARLQTVSAELNPLFYDIIMAFKKLTGIGAIINTSFNVRGEPIVCTPIDAYNCFMNTGMDALYIENIELKKEHQERAISSTSYFEKD